MSGAAHLAHLVRRFIGSLDPRGPDSGDERWVAGVLSDGERALWRRMSGPDRRHAVAVARRVAAMLGGRATDAVIAAALLHDAGKVEAGLGTFARSAVTAAALVVGRDRVIARRIDGRPSRYLRHDELGARLLEEAGADPLTVAWARDHHLPEQEWTLPPDIARALKAADDD